MPIQVQTIVSAPFEENSYVVWDGPECVIVDPGFEPDLIVDFITSRNLQVAAILNTHGHVDHIAGNAAMKKAYPDAPLMIGRGDALMLTDANVNMSAAFGLPIVSPAADRLLDDGETLEIAGFKFQIMHIPGHSPGHIVFYQPGILLGGDVLFRESIGRTDFPGGSLALLLSGIRTKLWPLPDDTIVYPGHNEPTTIGHEKNENPFLIGDGQE